VLAAGLLGVALAIPQQQQQQQRMAALERAVAPVDPDPVPASVATGCKAHVNQTECASDKCCNWCGPKTAAPVPVGWCMPMLPVATGLVCAKEPPTCSPFKTNVTCLAEDDCKWIPTSPVDPGNMGLCMYDWDMCKAPPATPAPAKPAKKVHAEARKQAAVARKMRAHKLVKPPAPAPAKLNCTIATAEECDASKCCQWCGSVWNTTAAGWCMPVLDEPIPMMTCSKGSQSCSSLPAATCNTSDTCSWMPFGPPGTAMGVCIFDWKKCSASPSV